MAVFSSFYSTLNGYNSLDIQDNDIKVYIFEISVKFRIDWYITCIGLKKVKIWLNTGGGYFRILTGFIFANDDKFAKINPRENLYSRKLILAKIYTLKLVLWSFVPILKCENFHFDCLAMKIGERTIATWNVEFYSPRLWSWFFS